MLVLLVSMFLLRLETLSGVLLEGTLSMTNAAVWPHTPTKERQLLQAALLNRETLAAIRDVLWQLAQCGLRGSVLLATMDKIAAEQAQLTAHLARHRLSRGDSLTVKILVLRATAAAMLEIKQAFMENAS